MTVYTASFFFSSRRRHTRSTRDWSSDVCSSDLLMRGREFLMYDGYSFDADAEGLDRSYRAQDAAYRSIFTRCGLEFTVVQADSGAIGGRDSEEFMVLADTGEDAVVRCAACGYGANVEKAETGRRESPWDEETAIRLEDVETPGMGGIEEVV